MSSDVDLSFERSFGVTREDDVVHGQEVCTLRGGGEGRGGAGGPCKPCITSGSATMQGPTKTKRVRAGPERSHRCVHSQGSWIGSAKLLQSAGSFTLP